LKKAPEAEENLNRACIMEDEDEGKYPLGGSDSLPKENEDK